MYNKDCFAFKDTGKRKFCSALTDLDCKNCKFYKTHEEYQKKCAHLKHK